MISSIVDENLLLKRSQTGTREQTLSEGFLEATRRRAETTALLNCSRKQPPTSIHDVALVRVKVKSHYHSQLLATFNIITQIES